MLSKVLVGLTGVSASAVVGMRSGLFGRNKLHFEHENNHEYAMVPLVVSAGLFTVIAGCHSNNPDFFNLHKIWISRLYFRPVSATYYHKSHEKIYVCDQKSIFPELMKTRPKEASTRDDYHVANNNNILNKLETTDIAHSKRFNHIRDIMIRY